MTTILDREFVVPSSEKDTIDDMIDRAYQQSLEAFAMNAAVVDFNVQAMELRSIEMMKKAAFISGKPIKAMSVMLKEAAFVSAIDTKFIKLHYSNLLHETHCHESAMLMLIRQIASALSEHVVIRHNGSEPLQPDRNDVSEVPSGGLDIIVDDIVDENGYPIERKLYSAGVSFMTESLMFWLSVIFKIVEDLDVENDSDSTLVYDLPVNCKSSCDLTAAQLTEFANLILNTLIISDEEFEERFYYRNALDGLPVCNYVTWLNKVCCNVKILDQRTADIGEMYDEVCALLGDGAKVANKTAVLDYLKDELKLTSVKVTASRTSYARAYDSHWRKKIDDAFDAFRANSTDSHYDDRAYDYAESLKTDYTNGKSVQLYVWKSDASEDFLRSKTIV